MTAVLAPLPADREPLLWLAPAPTWIDGAPSGDAFDRPLIVEYDTDDFVPAFLGQVGDPSRVLALGERCPAVGSGGLDDPLVLYRPVHQRYYLVVGSLVCRRIGLPDRRVDRKLDRVSFVIRRRRGAAEQAWRPASGAWIPVEDPERLVDGEEQHPMYGAAMAALDGGPAARILGLDDDRSRALHYGYVAVAATSNAAQPLDDPVSAVESDPGAAIDLSGRNVDDPRLMAFRVRVTGPWSDMAARQSMVGNLFEPSLYLLLDLRSWLAQHLPDVLEALVDDTTLSTPASHEALRDALDIAIRANGATLRLGTALGQLAGYESLLTGVGTEPTTHYDVVTGVGGLTATLAALAGAGSGDGGLVLAALDDGSASPASVPDDLVGRIVPRSADPAADDDRFVLRLVYEHEPCAPVVSRPSDVVRFAGMYDPDAPARPIRIELPDPDHLRRFARGVAIDMPPSLRRILDGVTPKILKEEGTISEGGWGIGMICTFSLQIIMLVAFIVMFIFLIVLNIVFWWLPFLKICFPVPTKQSDSP